MDIAFASFIHVSNPGMIFPEEISEIDALLRLARLANSA